MTQLSLVTNEQELISLTDVCAAMGITKRQLRAIRTPKSLTYRADFPKALERTTIQTYFYKAEFEAYLSKLTAIADTGVDPLAPRTPLKRGRKAAEVSKATAQPKCLNPYMIENIRSNVMFSLFGNDFFFQTALSDAVHMSGTNAVYDLVALGAYHGRKWTSLYVEDKKFIISTIRNIFSTKEDAPFQEWKGSICSELYEVQNLLTSKKNWFSKWIERRHPLNAKYKVFLSGSLFN